MVEPPVQGAIILKLYDGVQSGGTRGITHFRIEAIDIVVLGDFS